MRQRGRSAGGERGASRALAAGVAATLSLIAARADADVDADRAQARAAYDRGAAAHARGDEATAARELALADALVPNAITLQAALEAALAADDAVLGMELSDRTQRGSVDAPLAALARKAHARFAPRVGRVQVDCPGATACAALLDGKPIAAARPVIVRPGAHVVVVDRDGRTEQRSLDVAAGGTAAVVVTGAASSPPAAPEQPSSGLSPGWFFAALGATVVAGGVTVGLAVDTMKKHGDFVGAGCAGPAHGDCAGLASAGLGAQRGTNVSIGVTAGLAAATAAIGVVTLRARGADRASVSVGAGAAALRVPFP